MAQTMHVNGNGSERGQRCPSADGEKDAAAPYYVETPYGYQLDLDFLKYVDDIERGNTIKKLSVHRKPKGATPSAAAAPRGSTSGGGAPAEWTSTDSLSSSNSDDKQSPVFFGGGPQVAAPLTPTLCRAACEAPQRPLLLPPPSPRFAPRHNPQVERTLMETRLRLEQERLLTQPPSEPAGGPPRRRLASFGAGSSSSLSSHSGSAGPSQISPGAPHPLPVNGHPPNGDYSLYYPSSMGSSIRHSPLSSGVATPVTNVSPLHLQQIREQMVVALRKLKELEEQVKTIPILQVKIAVLQEEKRQLAAQSKSQAAGSFRKRSFSVGSAAQMEAPGAARQETELHIMEPEAQRQDAQRLDCAAEFRRLAAEVQALDGNAADARESQKSVGMVTDENMASLRADQRARGPRSRDAAVSTERRETRSAAVGVTEAMLGTSSEAEREMELQQQTIESLKEKIYRMEVQLKETTHQLEMGKLKLELQAAGGSGRKRVDKGSTARPETYDACVEARVQTRSVGAGEHLGPSTQSVAAGPETPMERWVVGVRVEVRDQCVGREAGPSVREAGVNTEESVDRLALCRPMAELSRESRSVGCGDCSVDVVVRPAKTLLSRGTDPERVGTADSAVTAAPESATRQTNTETEVASKSTNTERSVRTDSSTDTGLLTCEKHTNTVGTDTRTVAAGEGLVRDAHPAARGRTVAVGTGADAGSILGGPAAARTRECGVGPVSVQENFLVGLKTRNIASGPSQPSGSEGAVRVEAAAPGGAGLDHYIERVQKLLQEQQMLLAENYSELADAFGQPQSQFGSINCQLASTLSSINSVMKCGSAEDFLQLQRSDSPNQASGQQLCAGGRSQVEAPPADRAAQQQVSAAEQKSRMDLQMSTALHGQLCSQSTLKSIMKKKDGRPDSNGTKKNLQFVGVNGGYETTSSDDSSSEDSSSSGSDEEEDEDEKAFEGEEEYENVEARSVSEEFKPVGAEEVEEEEKKQEEEENSEKQEMRERYSLSEKMLSATNVLRAHLSDPKAVSSKDLRTCINTVQHEWFRVSSQKSASAPMVGDYLAAFGAVSPAVLRHVVNMADGNGNTALHYSVSHSNFLVVKELLDADVCNVNQQNKAGYTPIMLAALAAVESPKDMRIVEELFSKGDVNARASQAGQTGLMLAVSHGRMDMVRALLAQGADVNVQDDEGSTALMCASEHGHVEIVKLLLARAGCDATLSDSVRSPGRSRLLFARVFLFQLFCFVLIPCFSTSCLLCPCCLPFRMRAMPCPSLWKQDTRTSPCCFMRTSTSPKPSPPGRLVSAERRRRVPPRGVCLIRGPASLEPCAAIGS
ncbi:KN motif and ankyrin repeat domain-containing protein 1a isoform X1 [Gasterosteus aculeatus]